MSYRIVSRSIGVLLLIAAGLKVYGFGVDPIARMGLFSAPGFQLLIIVVELGLGLWLLSGTQAPASWVAVVTTFLVFACVSFFQGWIGQASCGCLGNKVAVNPWIMFSIDSAAIAALLLARPDLRVLWKNRVPIARTSATVLGIYAAIMGMLAGFAYLGYGSIDAAIASLRRERLSIYPRMIDMGAGAPGETREANVELTNRTDHAIRIFGGTADCSCTVLADLPVTIPAGESRLITVSVHLPNASGAFNRKAALQVDDLGFQAVSFRLTGRINKASK